MRAVPLPLALLALLAGCAPSGPPPVVLVSIDTLRADRLGAYGSTAGLTPNLDRFAAESVVFDAVYAQANQTNLSHASLFTGRYASELGSVARGFSPSPTAPTLAEVLAVYGYDTAGFTAGGHLTRGFGLERGFSTWETPQELGSFFHTVPPALAWLDAHAADPARADRPFLLFVHSYDTHERYLKPAPLGLAETDPAYRGPAFAVGREANGLERVMDGWFWSRVGGGPRLDPSRLRIHDGPVRSLGQRMAGKPGGPEAPAQEADLVYLRGLYDGAVTYADGWFGALVEGLDQRGVLDRAVVIVLSDHGESLGEEGLFGHSNSLTDADLRVPLLVHLPEGAGRRVEGEFALLDVLPTVAELVGATAPAGQRGQSLVPWLRGGEGPRHEVVYSEGPHRMLSARSAAGRLVFTGVDVNAPYLPELLRTAALDGPAFVDSHVPDVATQSALRDATLTWRSTLPVARGGAKSDPALVNKMRQHGYFEAQ